MALGGCGGGAGGDAQAITATITQSTTNSYPANCLRLHTRALLEQSTKLRGRAAVLACEEEAVAGAPVADRVTVTEIEVDGTEASADVAFEGTAYDGQTLTLALVDDGERWKIARILGFVDLDAGKLAFEIGRAVFEGARTPAETQEARCFLGELERLNPEKLEALIVDPSPNPLLDLLRPCTPRSETV